MEVVVPSPGGSPTFEFNGARTSPYLSAPSSPKRFGEYYLSAPTSPSRISEIYNELGYFSASSSIPFDWEQRPGTPKKSGATSNRRDEDGDGDNGFAFFVSGESERSSRSAEELFDGGKIKPLELEDDELSGSARSPLLPERQHNNRSPIAKGKKVLREALSPRKKKESVESIEQTRGRDRTPASVLSSSHSGRRVTRSHSPYRISHYTWDELEQYQLQQQQLQSTKEDHSNSKPSLSSTSSSTTSKSSRKWRLRDFLLFRSASEGRGTNKDPLRKYPFLYNKKTEEAKNQSFRSSENNPNSAAPGSRRKGPVSPHELHYAWKKAESEDLKKKTFLPYKQGILGRLAGFGSLTR